MLNFSRIKTESPSTVGTWMSRSRVWTSGMRLPCASCITTPVLATLVPLFASQMGATETSAPLSITTSTSSFLPFTSRARTLQTRSGS